MAVALGPAPKFTASDNNGAPLSGGRLYTFASGTSTPLSTFTDSTGATPNLNPVILDSRGEASVWLTVGSAYRFLLRDSTDATTFYTIDGIVSTPNADPSLIDDYSATTTQMRLTTDPGEVGLENPASNLGGEIERLRHAVREMKGTAQWYETYTTRRTPLIHMNYALTAYPDAADLTYQWFAIVPPGFLSSGAQNVKCFLSDTVASGSARMIYQYGVIRDDATVFTSGITLAAWTPATTTKAYLRSFVIAPNTFLEGDVILFQLGRTGTHVDDTNTGGTVSFQGGYFEYTGVAGR